MLFNSVSFLIFFPVVVLATLPFRKNLKIIGCLSPVIISICPGSRFMLC